MTEHLVDDMQQSVADRIGLVPLGKLHHILRYQCLEDVEARTGADVQPFGKSRDPDTIAALAQITQDRERIDDGSATLARIGRLCRGPGTLDGLTIGAGRDRVRSRPPGG